uniref:Tau95_N domain-containing protein n=1 Tax=Angiostrongylus cantonensis TaxID=6313 RepID=A0A0K0CZD6_ANGCA
LDSKCAESEFNGSTHFSEHSSRIHIHNGKGENRTLDEPDSHCEQSAALRVAPPPQSHFTMSAPVVVILREENFIEIICKVSLPFRESHSTRHYNEIAQEKVDDQIDSIFEFTEEHDELGTVGCEKLPEKKISVLKDCDAETVQDDSISHNRDVQHISRVSAGHRVPFSSSAAPPAAGVDVHTHKSREETIGKKNLKGDIDAQEKQIKMTLKVLALARRRKNLMAQRLVCQLTTEDFSRITIFRIQMAETNLKSEKEEVSASQDNSVCAACAFTSEENDGTVPTTFLRPNAEQKPPPPNKRRPDDYKVLANGERRLSIMLL